MINMIERDKCAVSNEKDLEHLFTFKNFPVFMGCVDTPTEDDLKADMSWGISKHSGMLQLQKLLPLDVLYQAGHDAGAVGALWKEHHREFARFIMQYSPRSIFEIGGGGGALEQEYQKQGDVKTSWIIIEPNPPMDDPKYIKGFFNENFKIDKHFDAVVHSHVFEHIYEIDKFQKNIASFIKDGKKLFFSVPNINEMLERKYTNFINFEHTVFITEPYIEYLLSKHGIEIVEKKYFKDDHSIFYACRAAASPLPVIQLDKGLYEKNKLLFLEYIDYHKKMVEDFNEKMLKTSRPIYLFGAHVFSQYLLEFGLNGNKIVKILDNALSKHGKRLYGTNLLVSSPKILKDIDSPIVILRAGVYNDEIKEDILKNINKQTEFWE